MGLAAARAIGRDRSVFTCDINQERLVAAA